jgi:cytochrome c
MFDFEKIFPAFLVAGILAMLSGFVADVVIHPHALEEDAIAIDGEFVVEAGSGVVAMPEPIMALLAGADIARGESLSKACAACHSFDQGGVAKVGPNLWNVVNGSKAHQSGFAYSAALVEKGGNWNYDSLNRFLWKPKSYISGTKMNYAGLKKPEDRAAVIAWMRSLSSSPAALPGEAEIAAEEAALAPPEPEVEEGVEAEGIEENAEEGGEEPAEEGVEEDTPVAASEEAAAE